MPEELGDMKKSMERKRNKEQYKRLIKLSFAAVMLLGLCFLYGVTWIGYYNKHILQIPFTGEETGLSFCCMAFC